jgi:malonyl-CoA/methylmalonyl-CoA synthetase
MRRPERSHAFIEDASGTHRVGDVMCGASLLGERLLSKGVRPGQRVILDGGASAAWAQAFFALIATGAVVVPVARVATGAELAYVANDAEAAVALVTHDAEVALPKGIDVLRVPSLLDGVRALEADAPAADAVAMILYTSGTTGAPKGALLTHANLDAQTRILEEAWAISASDVLLHALPMHHLHGIVVALLTTLLAGGSVIALPKFDPSALLDAAARATVLMAVPTMYARIADTVDGGDVETRARWSASLRALRLMTSGSAALPVSLAEKLRSIAGVIPLERYGMTEIGMALSSPLDPGGRCAGRVGTPLPSVEVRIVDDAGHAASGPGELRVRGPSVFAGYHRRESETREAFADGWFRTGDVGERDVEGSVRLLGRSSVDILKSGGEKVSAVEVEETLREHEALADVAVVGVPDDLWGDRIVAFVVRKAGADVDEATLRAFAKARLAPFKVPKEVRFVEALPRNAMGKVQKRALLAPR